MSELFISILNMSITASYVALAVLFMRLFMKKAPKKYSYALWSLVLFRLICPFSFQSTFSLFGLFHSTNEFVPLDLGAMQQPAVNTGIQGVNTVLNSTLPAATPASSVNPMEILLRMAALLWVTGLLAWITYSIITYIRTKNKIRHATLVCDNIYETDQFRTPFVLGFIRPKIYIPSHTTPEEYPCVIQHEKTHIRHWDHWIKPLAFTALAVHWFNPLMWLCYRLFSKDIEMSCDERVMRSNDSDIRETYSRSLLSLSSRQSGLISPLAFGESHVKARIKNVLHYRKPVFWISAVVLIAIMVLSIPLLSNAVQQKAASSVFGKETPMKGLELYVWKNNELMGNSDTYFTLLLGTNRNKVEDEIYSRDNAVNSIAKVNELLAKYSEETSLFIYQMNTTDFTKAEMQTISEKLDFPKGGNGSTAIGVWQSTLSIADITSMEPSAAIDKCLEIILSSPLNSSNSQDYIDAHQQEYQTILKYGDTALDYLLLQFRTGENNNGLRGVIMMGLCKQILGDRNNVTDPTLLPEGWFNSFLIRTEVELPDFIYDGEDPVEKLVYETELNQEYNLSQQGFTIIAPKIHGRYEEGDKLKVFITTFDACYRLYDKILSLGSASIIPGVMTFVKNADGSYALEDYTRATDGMDFGKSIQDYCTMPVSGKKIRGLADRIIKEYGTDITLAAMERKNLIKHLKANHQTGITYHANTGEMIPLT